MRLILTVFLIFLQISLIISDDEFATIWAPKKVYEKRNYNVVILPTNIIKRTEISLQFRKCFGTISLATDKLQKISIKNNNPLGTKKEFDLTMTLLRNDTKTEKAVPKCMTKQLFKLEPEKKNFFVFIQLDKPIYKPNDVVKFRIIVVSKDLKPYHFSNINVKFTDPFNRFIKEFDDPEEMYLGVFSNNFKLSPVTPLGTWNIHVVVDKKPHWGTNKTFNVQKYTLPPFSAQIIPRNHHILIHSLLQLQLSARYSFGDYVRGNIQLYINGAGDNPQQYFSRNYTDVGGPLDVKFKVTEDLNIITTTEVELDATIVFTEPESGLSANKTTRITVHAEMNPKIVPIHPDKFMPGIPFGVKVFVYDEHNKMIVTTVERVHINYDIQFQDKNTETVMADVEVKDGVAIHNFIISENAIELIVKVKYINVEYRKKIDMGNVEIGVNKITVDHLPKNPKYADKVDIYVRGNTELDNLVVLIMSRHGNIESHHVQCAFQVVCKFNITIKKDMMPESKVMVYYITEKERMYHGETTIITNELAGNNLDIELQKSAKTREPIDMTFKTRKDSQVYLLAFDKRLTYLGEGNAVQKDDVVKEIADYDGTNHITVFNMTDWHDCTDDELDRVAKGRKFTENHGGGSFIVNDDGTDIDEAEFEVEDPQQQSLVDPTDSNEEIREFFPETWIFESFDVPDGTLRKTFNTTDSITSWMIYGFSMNTKYGLAIADTKELTVKNQFFMKMFLPYSIRYNEIIRLDVMVYNYVESKEELDVTVNLINLKSAEFEFVEYNNCTSSFNRNRSAQKNVKVPYEHVKRVSFHIRPFSAKPEYEKLVKIRVDAVGKTRHNEEFKDKILDKLKVEPIGIKIYDISSQSYQLSPAKPPKVHIIHANMTKSLDENVDEFPRIKIAIAGDFLTDAIDMKSRFEFYPWNCLEQRTSKIKGNVEYFRYMKAKNSNPPTTHFSDYYQSLLMERTRNWSYKESAGYRAYFIEAIASAMEVKALPNNPIVIEKELDALKNFQTADGDFSNFGTIPENPGNTETGRFFQTAYILIPFLKFRQFVRKNYDDVINKAFEYLNRPSNNLKLDKQAFSISAYAYALNNNSEQANKLLKAVEDASVVVDKSKQTCYKISRASSGCDLRHTSYTAIAYLAVNDTIKARKAVAWLLMTHNLNKYYSNTHPYAIATEAIAKYVMTIPSKITDFTVNIQNDGDFMTNERVTKKNISKPIEIDLPDYSLMTNISASGSGYCSITSIIEKTVAIPYTNSKFKTNVTQQHSKVSNQKIIRVCGNYNPGNDLKRQFTLTNVIYDVEIPSGYIYSEIVGLESKSEIKLVEPKQKGTRIQIYYNEFEKEKDYCVDIKATKIIDVKNVQNAGVMIYDYNEKINIAVDFYTFESECLKNLTKMEKMNEIFK